MIQCTKDKTN